MKVSGQQTSIPFRKRPADWKEAGTAPPRKSLRHSALKRQAELPQTETTLPRKSPRLSARKRQTEYHQAETTRPEKAARLTSEASAESLIASSSSRARKITKVKYKSPPQWEVPTVRHTLKELNRMAIEATEIDPKLKQHHKIFKKDLADFKTGFAKTLQKKLLEQSKKTHGWLKPFWDEMYLKTRDATPINVSFAVEFDKSTWREQPHHEQLADVILAAYEHYDQIQTETLPQDTYTTRDQKQHPVCMDQVFRLFNNRKPAKGEDFLKPCTQEGAPSNQEQHILVLSGGHMHTLQIAENNGNRIKRSHLAKQLAFLQTKKPTRSAVDLTPLTAVDRDTCATLQTQLLQDSDKNARLMQQVDNAFCCICLDSDRAADPQDTNPDPAARQCLAGHGYDRWFDKTVQITMQTNGTIGAVLEHTPADADAHIPLFNRINENLSTKTPEEGDLEPIPQKLNWDIHPSLKESIETQRSCFKAAIQKTHLKETNIPGVGRSPLKDHFKISPDSFYQVTIQVAAWRVWKSMVPTYEAVAMRHLHLGRTECLRSWSPETIALANGLEDPLTTHEQKQKLLKKAAQKHSQKITACKSCKGIVRHLFALRKIWEKFGKELGISEMPRLFENPLFKALITTNTLSTSCVVSPSIQRFLFGPVEDDGLGIAYYPDNDAFRSTISYNEESKEKAAEFEHAFTQVIDELKALHPMPRSAS